MRLPWELERARLLTDLAPDECRRRLAAGVIGWDGSRRSSRPTMQGWVRARSFYLGRAYSAQPPPRTWVRGRIADTSRRTRIDLVIGPSAISGFVVMTVFAFLMAGALLLTLLALTTPFAAARSLVLAWSVVVAYAGLFFVLPELDFETERAFLVDFLTTALDAREASEPL